MGPEMGTILVVPWGRFLLSDDVFVPIHYRSVIMETGYESAIVLLSLQLLLEGDTGGFGGWVGIFLFFDFFSFNI